MVLTMNKPVRATSEQVVYREEYANGWAVEVIHSLKGFGHIYVENKPYSVAIMKPAENFADYSTVGTAEEALKIIEEVVEYEEDM